MKKEMLSLNLKPEVRVYLKKENKIVMGKGTYLLLKEIHKRGNIMEASKSLKISYKKALKLIKRVEEVVGERVVETRKGGASHGVSKLTDIGLKLIEIYEKTKNIVEESIKNMEYKNILQ